MKEYFDFESFRYINKISVIIVKKKWSNIVLKYL